MELVPPGHDDTGSLLRAVFGDHYRVASHPLRIGPRRGITVALTIAVVCTVPVAAEEALEPVRNVRRRDQVLNSHLS